MLAFLLLQRTSKISHGFLFISSIYCQHARHHKNIGTQCFQYYHYQLLLLLPPLTLQLSLEYKCKFYVTSRQKFLVVFPIQQVDIFRILDSFSHFYTAYTNKKYILQQMCSVICQIISLNTNHFEQVTEYNNEEIYIYKVFAMEMHGVPR